MTGVQRFANEISKRLPHPVFLRPMSNSRLLRLSGTAWEQLELPLQVPVGFYLLNLCNTAPLAVKNNVLVLHDLSFERNEKWFSWRFVSWYRFLIPKLVKRAVKIITVSEFSKSEICELYQFPKDDIHIISNGVSIQSVCDPIPLPFERYILCVASIDPRKNLSTAIDAFLASDIPAEIGLVVVGRSNKIFAPVVSPVHTSSRVHFTGYVTDGQLETLYRNALAFVYPSFYEGFGLPPIEAMARGCPAIVSNTSSLPEVCGDAAIYVDPHDLSSIIHGIEQVTNSESLRRGLSEKGIENSKKFSWDISAAKLQEIMSSL